MSNRAGISRRGLLRGAALTGLLASGCGYLLYPERRGRTGGYLDVGPFVVDLIWLIPGLIPGIVCLIVDFTTGCIYAGSPRGEEDRPRPSVPTQFTVEVSGAEVARGEVGEDGRAHLVWSEQVGMDTLRAHGRIVARGERDIATAHVRDLI